MSQIGRRQLLLVAGAMLAVPRLGWGQAKGRPVRIAILEDGNKRPTEALWRVVRARLRELGWVEGENILFIERFSQGVRSRLPALAAELVRLTPDVIVVVTTPATRAVMRATSTIPIIFGTGDPLGAGLVSNLARPGGNASGQSIMGGELSTKLLEFLTELVPGTKKVAMLGQANNRTIAAVFRTVRDAAASRGISVRLLEATQANDVDSAFETMAREHFDGFIGFSTAIVLRHRRQIVDLAARYRLPGVYPRDEYVAVGGLLSYAPDRVEMFRTYAEQVHRVLNGTNPGDLPIQQPRKFILTINLKTARALGLTVPRSILLLADRVIE
jgi:putative ABC transport system substrate-binding protein